jgi:hypothetical protein
VTKTNATTILIAIGLVVLPYLLTQSEVDVPGVWKVIIQSGIFALGILARYSNPNSDTQKVSIEQPVQVTAAPPQNPNPTEPQP